MAGGRTLALYLMALVVGGAAWGEEPMALPDPPTIERFAKVQAAVAEIRRAAALDVVAQPEPDERSRLRREAQQRMRQVAEAQGLSVADFNRLMALTRENPAFRAQVERSR